VGKCKKCGSDSKVKAVSWNPFKCPECGRISFTYKAIRSKVYIFQKPAPKKIGTMYMPDVWRDKNKPSIGQVLSAGPGYHDKESKYHPSYVQEGMLISFDKDTPWPIDVTAPDGNVYVARLMPAADVKAEVIEE